MNRRKRQSPGEEMYDRTDRYVLGMMDEEERTTFEKDMKEDASLADSVSLRRMVVDEVRRREELRDTFLAVEAAHPYQEGAPADPELDRSVQVYSFICARGMSRVRNIHKAFVCK